MKVATSVSVKVVLVLGLIALVLAAPMEVSGGDDKQTLVPTTKPEESEEITTKTTDMEVDTTTATSAELDSPAAIAFVDIDMNMASSTQTPTVKTFEELIEMYQTALDGLRSYNFLSQTIDVHPCETCKPVHCNSTCLTVLTAMVRKPVMLIQKSLSIDQDGILTENLINKMYTLTKCGDTNKNSVGRTKRWARLGTTVWPKDLLPLTISVANAPRGYTIEDVEQLALECATMWAEPSSLNFQLAARGEIGNIAIRFTHIDGPWNTVGLGLSPVPFGRNPSSYLKLDSAERWKRNKNSPGYGVSMKWAICHEMGHNLGLSHSTDRTAIMYSSGIGQDERKLPRDDFIGITTLYRGRDGKTIFGRKKTSGPAPRPNTPRPYTPRPNTPRPYTRRPYTPRPTSKPYTRATTRSYTTRSRHTTTTPRPTERTPTSYNKYKPPSGKNYAPPGHRPNYRPSATRSPPRRNPYWHYDSYQKRWVLV